MKPYQPQSKKTQMMGIIVKPKMTTMLGCSINWVLIVIISMKIIRQREDSAFSILWRAAVGSYCDLDTWTSSNEIAELQRSVSTSEGVNAIVLEHFEFEE